jgi:glycerophosphoryl diester phosphodiesterase
MCIEIKSHTTDQASEHVNELTEKIIEHINQPAVKPFKDHFLILSFDPHVLAQAYKMDPEVRYVLNLPEHWQPDKIPATNHLWAVDVRISKLSPALTHWAHQRRLKLFTYTCNGPRQVKKALDLGVDAIITDRPAWLAQHLGRQ